MYFKCEKYKYKIYKFVQTPDWALHWILKGAKRSCECSSEMMKLASNDMLKMSGKLMIKNRVDLWMWVGGWFNQYNTQKPWKQELVPLTNIILIKVTCELFK